MSNGWSVIAEAETENGNVMVREVWGSYAPDYQRTIEVTDGQASFFITPEQLSTLTEHLQDYADRVAADQESRRPDSPGTTGLEDAGMELLF